VVPNDAEQPILEEVAELPMSIVSIDNESIDQPALVSNQVRLHLQTAGLAVQLQTQPTSVQVIELAAQLDLVTKQLKESHSRLETAFFRIGFLEAQLERKNEELEEARKQLLE
jgi:hypothetical protein